MKLGTLLASFTTSVHFIPDILGQDTKECVVQGEYGIGTCEQSGDTENVDILRTVAHAFGCPTGDHGSDIASRSAALRCIMGELFPVDIGFQGDSTADRSDEDIGVGGTYGEITSAGLQVVIDHLDNSLGGSLGSEDVFLDAGSGVGKLPIQIFLSTNASKAIGVEFHPRRCSHALSAAESLYRALAPKATLANDSNGKVIALEVGFRSLQFVCGDVRELTLPGSPVDLAQVSVFFMNSLCFPLEILLWLQKTLASALSPGALVFSSRDLVGCHRGLAKLRVLSLVGTDSVPPVLNCYVAVPPLSASSDAFRSLDAGRLEEISQKEHWVMSRKIDIARLLAGFRQRLPRRMSSQSVQIQSDKFVSHREKGEDEFHICMLRDLMTELLSKENATFSEHEWRELVFRSYPDGVETKNDSLSVVDDSGNTLYHYAVELRSSALLYALHQVSAEPGINVANAAGESPCTVETTYTGKIILGTGLLSLSSELGKKDPLQTPPGALLPQLRELGAECVRS